jgi:hypothetical protein
MGSKLPQRTAYQSPSRSIRSSVKKRGEGVEKGLKTAIVIVPASEDNRDSGKQFLLTEWPAARAEKWAVRMFLALKGTGSEIAESSQRLGMVGVAFAGLNAFLRAEVDPDVLEPLLDQMFECVKVIRDPKAVDKDTGGPVATDIVSDDDIREIKTRFWLRSEVLKLHTNFSFTDALSSWLSTTSIQKDS